MISYWLKFYRHECGLTQQQVADRLKIERSTYTYYETGKTKPDINTLIKIAKVYNISYTKLLEGIEDELENVQTLAKDFNTVIVGDLERSKLVQECDRLGTTVMNKYPDSDMAKQYTALADEIMKGFESDA